MIVLPPLPAPLREESLTIAPAGDLIRVDCWGTVDGVMVRCTAFISPEAARYSAVELSRLARLVLGA